MEEVLFSPRRDIYDQIILSVEVTGARDNREWESHSASCRVETDDQARFAWDRLGESVLRQTARRSPRGYLGEDAFAFQGFAVDTAVVELGFKLWFHDGIFPVEWFRARISAKSLSFCDVSVSGDPPDLVNPLEASEPGEVRVHTAQVLGTRAELKLMYQGEAARNKTGATIGRVCFLKAVLQLPESGILAELRQQRGHKVVLMVDSVYLGRANQITDQKGHENDEDAPENDPRSPRGQNNRTSLVESPLARSYGWLSHTRTANPATWRRNQQQRRRRHEARPGNKQDLDRVRQVIGDWGKATDRRASASGRARRGIFYTPDAPTYTNKDRILPIEVSNQEIAEFVFADLKYSPAAVVRAYVSWEDFLDHQDSRKEPEFPKKALKEGRPINRAIARLKRLSRKHEAGTMGYLRSHRRRTSFAGELIQDITEDLQVRIEFERKCSRPRECVRIEAIRLVVADLDAVFGAKRRLDSSDHSVPIEESTTDDTEKRDSLELMFEENGDEQ